MPQGLGLQGIPRWQKKKVNANPGECARCGGGWGGVAAVAGQGTWEISLLNAALNRDVYI